MYPFWRILTAPRLSQTLTRLGIHTNEAVLRLQSQPLPCLELSALQSMDIQFYIENTPPLNPLLATFLSQLPHSRAGSIEILLMSSSDRVKFFDSHLNSSRRCLDLIDRALCLPQFSSLTTIYIRFAALRSPEDVEYFSAVGPSFFSRLRARDILNITISGVGVYVEQTIVAIGSRR